MLIDMIKAVAKEGSDFSEIEKAIKELDPLKNLDKENVGDFIKRNQLFNSYLDAETSRRAENAIKNFQSEKMPAIIEEAVKNAGKEPELTPEQKRLIEMEKTIKAMQDEKTQNELKTQIMSKASELGFKINADRYALFGEKALEYLEDDFKSFKEQKDLAVKDYVKQNFGKTIETKSEPQKANTIRRADFEQLPPAEQSKIALSGATITD